MRIINFLLFCLYFSYFGLLFYRVVGQRNPIDHFSMTGFIFFSFSCLQIFSLGLRSYRKIRSTDFSPSERFLKIRIFIGSIMTYLDVEFLQKSLNRNPIINWFFYWILVSSRNFTEEYPKRINFFKWTIFLIPWLIGVSSFFLELFFGTNLFFTLYFFSFALLLKQLFYGWLYIGQMKYCHLNILLFQNYLPEIKGATKIFFLVNTLCMEYFLQSVPQLQNKKMLRYLWNLFSEINSYRLAECSMHVSRLAIYKPLDKKLKLLNLNFFGFTFFLLLFEKFFQLNDLFYCSWFFLMLFSGFLIWLNGLIEDKANSLFYKNHYF